MSLNDFKLQDSGDRTVFNTGAQRDMSKGKGRYDLISPIAMEVLVDVASDMDMKWYQDETPSSLVSQTINSIFSCLEGNSSHLDEAFFLSMVALQNEVNSPMYWERQENEFGYSRLAPEAVRRVAVILEKGAEKYEARNWEKGMPVWKYLDSGLRHFFKYLDGQRDEDHLGQGFWNLMAAVHTREMVRRGKLPNEFGELPNYL